jgi:hypothetical protein
VSVTQSGRSPRDVLLGDFNVNPDTIQDLTIGDYPAARGHRDGDLGITTALDLGNGYIANVVVGYLLTNVSDEWLPLPDVTGDEELTDGLDDLSNQLGESIVFTPA